MIDFHDVTVTYPGAPAPALRGVDLAVPEGELWLVVGPTGSGKSTLLGAVNGLVPHFSGGQLSGRVVVAGRDTAHHPPRELADVVGVVGQQPAASFVADVVEDELAYAMESLGVPPAVMRRRVEETLDLLGLVALRDRPLRTLSGGEAQRVAIGAVLTAGPRVLVLDEPTSALDPGAAEEVLAALLRLVHDLGMTVLLAEHRLERVAQYADAVVRLEDGRLVDVGAPARVLETSPVAPPVVQLARLAGWSPPPLSVRDARRLAEPLRDRLVGAPSAAAVSARPLGDTVLALRGAVVRYGTRTALAGVDLTVRGGEVVALMGRNGAGKSSLLASCVGVVPLRAGTVRVGGQDPAGLGGPALLRQVGLVPADPADLLAAETVTQECAEADTAAGVAPGTTLALAQRLSGGVDPATHPRELSEGQRLAVALAAVLAARPPLLALDEPTRGLDYQAKGRLVTALRELAADGHAVLLATHDVELAADLATRTVVLADGEVVADGPTAAVVTDSPAFAPQVAKVLAPLHLLTVPAVAAALAVAR